MPAAATPGTLEEFDLILSVNEASINQQFLLLYLTPLRKNTDPDPLPPTPGKPASNPLETEYLISHKLTIKGNGGKSLSGYIECPRVDFSPIENKQRTVKVIFKLLKNEKGYEGDPENGIPAYDKKYDSKFVYYTAQSEDDPPTIRQEKSVNGYTFSFEAGLGKADIHKIEQKLLHPDTYNVLKDAVQSEDLTPSSIFCLFQAKEIANSFTMQDPSGNIVSDSELLGEFMLLLKTKFAPNLAEDQADDDGIKPGKGHPTPENPFVLGYGISQESSSNAPSSLLVPKNFQFSVTSAGPKGFPTLNFLMLTRPIEDINNVQKNLTAGYLKDNLFETIGATYVHSQSNLPEFEGVMAVSSGVFLNQYIISVVLKNAWIPLPNGWSSNGSDLTVVKDSDPASWAEGNNCKRTQSWKSAPEWNLYTNKVGLEREKWWGTNEIQITWESDPKLDGGEIAMDRTRTVLVWIEGSATVTYERHRLPSSPALSVVTAFSIGLFSFPSATSTDWEPLFTMTVPVRFKHCLVVSVGDMGEWVVKEDQTKMTAPLTTTDDQGKKHIVISDKIGEPGIVPEMKYFGKILDIGFFDVYWGVPLSLILPYQIGPEVFNAINEQLNVGNIPLGSLQSKVVMPAGDVISFNGVSADSSGHLYSLVKYKTKEGGDRL